MTEQTRKGIISFSISDRGALYSSFLSYVRNGGLFVPTPRGYELGDSIFMLLKLMDNPCITPVSGKVIWVTPVGAQGNKVPGIGVQFDETDGGDTLSDIEQHLAAAAKGERPTHTM